jgi:hypothetical protein
MSARRVFAVALPVLFVMQAAAPAAAQDVRAEVQIRTGPVQGRIIVGGDARRPIERERVVVVERRRHAGERIVIERRNPRRVRIVEDFRTSTQRAHGRHDNRHIVAWWDPRNDDYGFQRATFGDGGTALGPPGSPSANVGYGYGLMISEVDGHRKVAHGGGINGFRTQLAHYPDDDLIVTVLVNADGNPGAIEAQIAKWALATRDLVP